MTASTIIQRKYRMTQINGVYIFQHNDGERIILVGSYEEYGDPDGGMPVGKFWCFGIASREEFDARMNERMTSSRQDADEEFFNWLGTTAWTNLHFPTRKAAINGALAS